MPGVLSGRGHRPAAAPTRTTEVMPLLRHRARTSEHRAQVGGGSEVGVLDKLMIVPHSTFRSRSCLERRTGNGNEERGTRNEERTVSTKTSETARQGTLPNDELERLMAAM